MDGKSSIIIFLIVLLIGGGVYIFSSSKVNETVSFSDVDVQPDDGPINQIAKGYITLPSITADENAIINLIGAVAVRSIKENEEEWSYILNFRPARGKIQTKIVTEQLFHGIVSTTANFGGKFQITSVVTSAKELAEVTITNQLIVGYKDPADIPFKELSKIKFSPGKDYFFIPSVVVTDITTKRFRAHTGKGDIQGMAFGANGAIYAERDAMKRQKVVSFLPVNPLDLQASESGSGTHFTSLTAKSRMARLSSSDAKILTDQLIKRANEFAPNKIPLGPPDKRLPAPLNEMDIKIWIQDIEPIRQSSQRRCWAAAMAMLFSWEKKRMVSEAEAVTSLGPKWEPLYNRDKPLPRSYKLDLINDANFKYSAPQSYTPGGLIHLIKENGPIWFTIDEEFNRHATILTGVFFDQVKTKYWVSYIDPTDGELKADSYAMYMRRYEAPAYRANAEGEMPAITESDLDIQIIHW